MRIPLPAILLLISIWVVLGGIIGFSRVKRPSPEKVEALAGRHDFASLKEPERIARVEEVAAMMARLSFEERQELRRRRKVDEFFRTLTSAEQGRFLDLTLPQGFVELMKSINQMDPAKRKRLVDRALADLARERETGVGQHDGLSEENRQKLIKEGLSAFYEEANAEVKLDFAPVLEQMQRGVQNLR